MITVLFAVTSFLSAFLLFQVQLIVSKHILPWFGGAAAVWTTSLLVFQLLLLAGYVYSHVVAVRLSPASQTKTHVALLAATLLLIMGLAYVWPSAITPGAAWKPQPGSHPARGVAAIILVSVGLPFFVLSTTAPLLQRWFARLGGGAKAYKLYSVSNLGSLLGLLTFPFLVEPALRLKIQGEMWSFLFGVFAMGCGLCGMRALRATGGTEETAERPADCPHGGPRPLVHVLWFLLPACASSLLLASTNLLCQEVTTVPLLWVLPLSLYLLSFILCFDHPRWYQRALFHPLFATILFLTCAALIYGQYLAQVVTLPTLLFLTCMICHGELVRLKPGVERLTSFYLAVSAGGAAGGVFVAIVAPRVFTSFAEFQWTLTTAVILLLVTLALDSKSWLYHRDFRLPALILGGMLLAGYAGGRWLPQIAEFLAGARFYPVAVLIGIIVVMGAAVMKGSGREERGFRFVQILVACIALSGFAVLYRSAQPKPGLESSARSFYGVVRVFRQPGSKELVHGQTIHGGQLDPPMNRFPATYYGPNSGIGVVLQHHPKRSVAPGTLRIGVVGMGAGTLAAYGRPGDYIRYYEINPDIVKLSSGAEPTFTYIRDSAASVAVVLGDARLSLERESAGGERPHFDVLVLDAFSGDAVPVHLLTKEAFETYWQTLDPETGILAVHITSRHVNLAPVLLGAAAHFHAECLVTYNRRQGPVFDSGWVLMARRPGLLNLPGLAPITVRYIYNVGPRLWTDDYSDIFRLIF